VKQGVGVQALMESGDTNPLFAAVKGDALGAVDALLAAGARLEVRDSRWGVHCVEESNNMYCACTASAAWLVSVLPQQRGMSCLARP
jgi:hypothetical protein